MSVVTLMPFPAQVGGAELMRRAFFNLRTTTGTQDLTIANFESELGAPQFARIWCTRPDNLDAVATNAAFSIGCYDGTSQFVIANQDKVGSSNSRKIYETDAILALGLFSSETVIDCEASAVGWITDGIRINVTNAPADDYLIVLELYHHPAWEFEIRNVALTGTQDLTQSIPLSFDPEFCMAFMPVMTPDTGLQSYPGSISEYYGTPDGMFARARFLQHPGSNIDLRNIATNSTGLPWINSLYVEIGYGTGQLTATVRNGAWAQYMSLVAINFGGAGEAWVGTVDSPNALGAASLTGVTPPDWTPSAAFVLMGQHEALGTQYTDNRSAYAWAAFNADSGYSLEHSTTDGGTYGEPASYVEADRLACRYTPSATLDVLRGGAFTGMVEGGIGVNMDAVADGLTYKWGLVLLRAN